MFSHIWKIVPKDKYRHKTKHDPIHTYRWNILAIVELFYRAWGRRERKENDTESTIL
jgi:hypothetical protein